MNNGASPYERVTLAMIEEKEKELLGDLQIDEGRIAAEVVIFSD